MNTWLDVEMSGFRPTVSLPFSEPFDPRTRLGSLVWTPVLGGSKWPVVLTYPFQIFYGVKTAIDSATTLGNS